MQISPFVENTKSAYGFTHKIELTFADLVGKTSGTAFPIFPGTTLAQTYPIGTVIHRCAVKLVTLFVSAGSTEIDLIIGDGVDPDRLLVSSSVGGSATPPVAGTWYINPTTIPFAFTAADTLDAVLTFTGGTAAASTAGKIYIYLAIANLNDLDAA